MVRIKKKVLGYFTVIFIILLVILPFISSATVVVNQPPEPKKPSFFETYFGFLLSPLFWGFVLFFILILLCFVGLFFLVRWIIKFLKSKSDIFFLLRKDRIRLAKIHRSYRSSKHWFKVYKNIPIRLVQKLNGKLNVSSPIAYHRGDYTTHEGNVIICMNLRDDKKWFIYPITSLLIIPDKESVDIMKKDKKGKEEIITIDNIPRAKDIVQFNEEEILIYAESISSIGMFYVPVLKAKDGKIIDLSLPVFQSLKDVVLGDYLYHQTSDFVVVAKKSIALNPNLAYSIKDKDSNTNVEIPQTQGGGR